MVEKEKDLKVKSIRSDRGGESLSENFARWCKSEGIRRQPTTPYTLSQNGVVERKNRTIMEMARAMLAHASLPRSYWAEACNTAVYIQNRSPTHALQDMTPFQAYYGCKPTVSHFRVFGCSAFVHIPKEKRQKLDFKSRKLLFLGYSAESDAYRLYDPDTRTTTVSRDVVFDESFITSAEGAAAQPIPILPPPSLPDPPASPVITPSTSHPVPPIQPPDVSPDQALSDSDSDLDVADATPEVDSTPPRREKRIPGWLYSTVASSGVTELPVPPPAGLPRRSWSKCSAPTSFVSKVTGDSAIDSSAPTGDLLGLYKKVLLPIIDRNPYLSEATRQAAATTTALAKKYGAEITVVVIDENAKESINDHDLRIKNIRWHLAQGGYEEFGLLESLGEGKVPAAIIGEIADDLSLDLVVLSMESIHSKHIDGNLLPEFVPCPIMLLPL
ncbi:hypothetical protein L7F22_067379 [Adiantum nelumboides]|nr:hypothetical protein [Adiantum nelumboides]